MAAGGKPDFSHVLGSGAGWQSYMERPSTQLEETLWKHMNTWGTCLVCGDAYPSNLKSHICGKNHCKKLQERLNWGEPTSPEDLERLTQYWPLVPGGQHSGYKFNHVTGVQGLCDFPGAATVPANGGAPAAAAPAEPVPVALNGYGGGGYGVGPAPGLGPFGGQAAASAAPAAASASPPTPPEHCRPGEIYPHASGFEAAIATKDGWRAHMEGASRRFEDYMSKATNKWDWDCKLCGKTMDQGANNHLTSQSHWKVIWQKMQELNSTLPPMHVACEMSRPWVQRYEIPGRGRVAFNHLTGGQVLEEVGGGGGGGSGGGGGCTAGAPAPGLAPPSLAAPSVASVPPSSPAASLAGSSVVYGAPLGGGLGHGLLAGPPPGPGGPSTMSFQHGQYGQAFAKDPWRIFMGAPAKFLEDSLVKATGHWDHKCMICDNKAMTRGAQDHLMSQNHFKALWQKVEALNPRAGLPPQHIAEEMEGRFWVQPFDVPGGRYLFNHLTGGQTLSRGGSAAGGAGVGQPGAPAAAAMAPQLVFAQAAPARSAAPPQASPSPIVSVTVSSAGGVVVAPGGGLAVSPAAQDARLVDHRLPVRNGVTYRQALEDKGAWSKFMEEPARRFETLIYKSLPGYCEQCPVCEANMNGIKEHLLSQKHFKCMWKKLGSVPAPGDVLQWDRPYVQKLRLPYGVYLYNHVTGEQGLEAEVKAAVVCGQAPPAAAAAAPAIAEAPAASVEDFLADGRNLAGGAAVTQPWAAHALADGRNFASTSPAAAAPAVAAPAASAAGAAAPTAGSALGPFEHWHWRGIVLRPAEQLAAALAQTVCPWDERAAPSDRHCAVCQAHFQDVEEHLASLSHYTTLRSRLSSFAESQHFAFDRTVLVQTGQPWIQNFLGGVFFNHATLETTTAAVAAPAAPASAAFEA
eukprot:CAMPEP_0203864430 /NCGR_PEP_ID=MMETSP0359-20131031/14752_1 /ASSEMBLY_ACC=CAM_ASM_000338 /TAXON_ID=268821 /ORGANISM="Scrippsiella Hangoei, Strain SHTV-5" /LENGTH=912 /DNA_ID=CAMNT_0050782159 /DNA_START=54 /DNA_END=2792 /DNA_ORIENTATION=+